MHIFKTALKTIFRHPTYLIIYAVVLSFLGVGMANGFQFSNSETPFTEFKGTYAVIDRDHSDLSAGIADLLSKRGNEVELADEELALQDAVAKGKVGLIVIIPEGFEKKLVESAQENSGEETPLLQTTYGFYSAEGSFIEQSLNEYVTLASTYAVTESNTSLIAKNTLNAVNSNATVESISFTQEQGEAQRFIFFLQWSAYTLFASISICVGFLMSRFEQTEVRRRNLTAPITNLFLSLQTLAAGFVVALVVWAWSMLLGMVSFTEAINQMSFVSLAFCLITALVFTTVPLSLGLLLGKLGANETVSNAVGNILGMAFSFLGGVWVPINLLDSNIQMLAHFFPVFWYNDALQKTASLSTEGGIDSSVLMSLGADLCVIALFSACFFLIALLVGKLRAQSSTACGNAAAAVPKS